MFKPFVFGSLCSVRFVRRYFSAMSKAFKTIGTHNGTFHCDEVLGCYLLKIINSEANIVRSRDPDVLDKCDIVIDVGSVYDVEKLRFDHHQKGFLHTMNSLRPEMPYNVKLSSAGLIYCHFGEVILENLLGKLDKMALAHLYKKVYENFVMEIDGIDNGVEMCQGDYNYTINTNLSKRVAHFNKKWNDKDDFDEDGAFRKAMELAGNEFVESVNYTYHVWWPARKIVSDVLNNRFQVHESGEIVQFDEFVPYIEHLLQLEKDMNINPTVKYAIYKDGANWRIRAIPVSQSSFICRVPLLEAWRGLRDEELTKAGVTKGAIFVHNTGFIGGHKEREGAIDMAVKSLQASKA